MLPRVSFNRTLRFINSGTVRAYLFWPIAPIHLLPRFRTVNPKITSSSLTQPSSGITIYVQAINSTFNLSKFFPHYFLFHQNVRSLRILQDLDPINKCSWLHGYHRIINFLYSELKHIPARTMAASQISVSELRRGRCALNDPSSLHSSPISFSVYMNLNRDLLITQCLFM